MLDKKTEIENIGGIDYGFAFNNRLAKKLFGWSPEELFSEKLPVIINNIKGASD